MVCYHLINSTAVLILGKATAEGASHCCDEANLVTATANNVAGQLAKSETEGLILNN